MNITNKLLGFRYKKNFILNRIKLKKLKLNTNPIKTKSHESCPICDCKDVDLIAEVDRVGFPCETVICQHCKFIFNNTYIANPSDFYSREWGDKHWGDPEKNFKRRTSTDSYSWKRMAYLAKNLNKEFHEIKNVLEVGCGDGCNLLPYHLIGKRVVGCDFDDRFLQSGRSLGMELLTGDVESIPALNSFDLVLLIHSFEHVVKMDETIQSIASRIVPDGLVFVEVPGVFGWNRTKSDTMQSMGLKSSNNVLGYLQFQHNYHFDLNHLKIIWERNGFEMIRGDEWVRAIFRKKKISENVKDRGVNIDDIQKNAFLHLSKVEKDFLSIRNLFCGFNKLILKKLCSYN
jgi:2-polyprenyl-3-methyl-5-hydroxy-6-metoxy-1,4-benzoquinol methylase